jgi:hypothetical protein
VVDKNIDAAAVEYDGDVVVVVAAAAVAEAY